ncbi:MAG TPA: hypothetical protein VGB91_06820 [Rhizomicrobium sp.]
MTAKPLAKVAAPDADLSADDVVRLLHCLRLQMVAFDDALWQHDAGLLDKICFETTRLNTARMLANPAMRATWTLLRPRITPHLVDRIEQLVIHGTPLARPRDWASAWKQAHADVPVGSGPMNAVAAMPKAAKRQARPARNEKGRSARTALFRCSRSLSRRGR